MQANNTPYGSTEEILERLNNALRRFEGERDYFDHEPIVEDYEHDPEHAEAKHNEHLGQLRQARAQAKTEWIALLKTDPDAFNHRREQWRTHELGILKKLSLTADEARELKALREQERADTEQQHANRDRTKRIHELMQKKMHLLYMDNRPDGVLDLTDADLTQGQLAGANLEHVKLDGGHYNFTTYDQHTRFRDSHIPTDQNLRFIEQTIAIIDNEPHVLQKIQQVFNEAKDKGFKSWDLTVAQRKVLEATTLEPHLNQKGGERLDDVMPSMEKYNGIIADMGMLPGREYMKERYGAPGRKFTHSINRNQGGLELARHARDLHIPLVIMSDNENAKTEADSPVFGKDDYEGMFKALARQILAKGKETHGRER